MFKVSVLDIKTTSAIFQKLVSQVVLPGDEGELSILDFHQSVISCLKDGLVRIDNMAPIDIKSGIASMQDNELIVLVEKK